MAKPFTIFKRSSGIYYCDFTNEATGELIRRSTGTRDYNEAQKVVLSWYKNNNVVPANASQKEEKIEKIAESMRTSGYDKAEPIVIDENNCVLEGNTRFLAAQRAGLKKVFVLEKRFSSEEEKLVYCYDRQLNRRNLSDAELYKAFQELEEIKGDNGKKKMTDNEIAEKLNTSRRQISKMREVQKKCDDEVLKNLQEGTITLNAAYNEMKEEEKQKAS